MKNLRILATLLLLLAASCSSGSSQQEQQAALEEKVMAVHDEAMADMDHIYKLRRSLRSLRDTLETQQPDSAATQLLHQHISGLNEADEAMMDWMRQYHPPDTLQHQQAMDYLQQELVKIEKVKTQMDSTIAAAREMHEKYEQN